MVNLSWLIHRYCTVIDGPCKMFLEKFAPNIDHSSTCTMALSVAEQSPVPLSLRPLFRLPTCNHDGDELGLGLVDLSGHHSLLSSFGSCAHSVGLLGLHSRAFNWNENAKSTQTLLCSVFTRVTWASVMACVEKHFHYSRPMVPANAQLLWPSFMVHLSAHVTPQCPHMLMHCLLQVLERNLPTCHARLYTVATPNTPPFTYRRQRMIH